MTKKPCLLAHRYKDLGLLERGGMGEVRRVMDSLLCRTLVMKIIKHDLNATKEWTARFLEEARTNAELQHPGIVPVHDYGCLQDGRAYFTMKEVRGATLSEVLREVHEASRGDGWRASASGWTFRRLIDVFCRACDAVAFAHERGVTHRDLKPANIMVGAHGEVLVIDWGLAKIGTTGPNTHGENDDEPIEHGDETGFQTQAGVVHGTPAYMPPELARGEADIQGPARDVYALGATLFEILAGVPPYSGVNAFEILRKVLVGPPPPPDMVRFLPRGQRTTLLSIVSSTSPFSGLESVPGEDGDSTVKHASGPTIPGDLQAICLKAMAREPGCRYVNAGQLAAEVRDWLEGVRRRERALEVLDAAQHKLPGIAAARERAAALRHEAKAFLDKVPGDARSDANAPGWEKEDEADRLERQADLDHIAYAQLLKGALTHVPDLPEAIDALARHYQGLHADAEYHRETRAAEQYLTLLRIYNRGQFSAYIKGDGRLTLFTDPPGAQAALFRYHLVKRRLRAEPMGVMGSTPIESLALPMGSYLLVLQAAGCAPVRYPIMLERAQVWDGAPPGDSRTFPVYLPQKDELDDLDIYVPAGWFWSGGDTAGLNSLPRRHLWLEGFVIRRFPVTNREYLVFVNDLLEKGEEQQALRWVPRERGSAAEPGSVVYGRDENGYFCLSTDGDDDRWLPNMPVLMIDWHGALAYAHWLTDRTGKPWRLPLSLEWEKAARGTDARLYPWGDFAHATWARWRKSDPNNPGPVVVDSYPEDESPYGVRGTAGNVREWCLDLFKPQRPCVNNSRVLPPRVEAEESGAPRTRMGGSWGVSVEYGRLDARSEFLPAVRDFTMGFRVARTFP